MLNCAPMDSKALKQQGQLRPELLEVPIPMVVVVGVSRGVKVDGYDDFLL